MADEKVFSYTASLMVLGLRSDERDERGRFRYSPIDFDYLEYLPSNKLDKIDVHLILNRREEKPKPKDGEEKPENGEEQPGGNGGYPKNPARGFPGGGYKDDHDQTELTNEQLKSAPTEEVREKMIVSKRDYIEKLDKKIIGPMAENDLKILSEVLDPLGLPPQAIGRTAIREFEEEAGLQIENVWLNPIYYVRRDNWRDLQGRPIVHFHCALFAKLAQDENGKFIYAEDFFNLRKIEIQKSENWWPLTRLPFPHKDRKPPEPGLIGSHYGYINGLVQLLPLHQTLKDMVAKQNIVFNRNREKFRARDKVMHERFSEPKAS